MKRGGILESGGCVAVEGGLFRRPATCTPPSGRGVSSTQLSPVPWLFVGGRPRCLRCSLNKFRRPHFVLSSRVPFARFFFAWVISSDAPP